MRIQLLLLLCLRPVVIHPLILDIMDDIVKTMDLKCVLMVLDDLESLGKIRRDVFRKLEVQTKVVLQNNVKDMQNMGKIDKCGVFMQFKKEEILSKYLEKVLEMNNLDQTIFKKWQWFIFLARDDSLDLVFRYDSHVYLIIEHQEQENVKILVETYSIEEGVKVNKIIGNWSLDNGIGKINKTTKIIRRTLEMTEKNHLRRRQDLMGKTMRTIYFQDKGIP